jgi:hypothetical protein
MVGEIERPLKKKAISINFAKSHLSWLAIEGCFDAGGEHPGPGDSYGLVSSRKAALPPHDKSWSAVSRDLETKTASSLISSRSCTFFLSLSSR